MAEFNQVANSPMEIELMGASYKVRRVPMDTIFGKAETAVISQQMRRIKQMAEHLEGEDKSSFLAKAMVDSIPSGAKLNQMTTEFLRSVDGVKMLLVDSLKKDQPEIEKQINFTELLAVEPEKVSMIVKFCTEQMGKRPPLEEGRA